MEMETAGAERVFSLIEAMDDLLKEPLARFENQQTQVTRTWRRLRNAYAEGNLSEMARQLATIPELFEKLRQGLHDVSDLFEKLTTLNSSAEIYARSFEEACKACKIPLEGGFPSYEVFPFEVRFHLDEQYVTVNGRTVRALRPSVLAEHIRKERDRLHHSTFNARRFRLALLRAHKVLSSGRGNAISVSLRQIHELLALREGSGTGGYTIKQFAFDLFRVRQDSLVEGNYRLVFIQGKSPRNTITVPVGNGETENLSALQIQEVL